MNGHVPSVVPHDNGDDVTVCDVTSIYRRHDLRSVAAPAVVCANGQSSGDTVGGPGALPHVVAYYEIESTKAFPKDARRSGGVNLGVEQLRAAIVRLSKGKGEDGGGADSTTVPLSWWQFARHLASVADKDPTQPCLPLYDVIAIGRSFDVAPRDARHALQHYARRGRVWVGSSDGRRGSTSSLVVVHPPWIVDTISRVLETVDSSVVLEQNLLDHLADVDVERKLAKASHGGETVTPASSARWLLALLDSLGVCTQLASSRAFLFSVLLETGSPGEDLWPETPDWSEKQVTCEVPLRRTLPGQFASLQVMLAGQEAVRHLCVVPHPSPTFFRHHVVFTTTYDVGPCEDCFRFSRRGRTVPGSSHQQQRSSAVIDHTLCRSTTISVDVPTVLTTAAEASSLVASSVVHRVRISIDCQMRSLSIQVRGPSPCCVMHAVIDFIDCYLDDDPVTSSSSSSLSTSANVETCSVKTSDDHILTNGGTTLSVTSSKSAAWRSRASTISAYRGTSYSCWSRDSVNGDTPVPDDKDENADEIGLSGDVDAMNAFNSDEARRRIYVVCPKCILMRYARPQRIEYPWAFSGSSSSLLRRRRPICSKWHNLGSWARVITGDYRVTPASLGGLESAAVPPGWSTSPTVGKGVGPPAAGSNVLSELDHPRLVVVVPSSAQRSATDWYSACQTHFLEGYEARFLCEYTGYWHVVDDAAYRFSSPAVCLSSSTAAARRRRRPGDQLLAAVVRLALPLIQCLNAVDEHPENAKLLAPVITELVDGYELLVAVDGYHQIDPCAWLTRYKDRIVSVLTKVCAVFCCLNYLVISTF